MLNTLSNEDIKVNRLLCFGTCMCIAFIYLLNHMDSSDVILWYSSINKGGMLLYAMIFASAIFFGIKEQFEVNLIRRTLAVTGTALLTTLGLATFTSVIHVSIRPIDAVVMSLLGIIVTVAGLSKPDQEYSFYTGFSLHPIFSSVREWFKKPPKLPKHPHAPPLH